MNGKSRMQIRIKLLLAVFVLFFINSCSKKVALYPEIPFASKPKNVILMIGDGMGLSHLSAHLYQQKSSILEEIKVTGLMKTHCADNLVTDSAASGTAMATGQKTFEKGIGVDVDSLPLRNIMEIAHDAGMLTGIVTTSGITNATPAAFFAHANNRYYKDSLIEYLLRSEIDFVVGGDMSLFDGSDIDHPSRLKELVENNYDISDYLDTRIELLPLGNGKKKLFFSGRVEPILPELGFRHLSKASMKAIDYFKRRPQKGFIMMVEEAQIDWACHNANSASFFNSVKSYELAVRSVLKYAAQDKETLVIITSDHATGGLAINPGSKSGKLKLKFTTNGHTADMVSVFAFGPGAEKFNGIYDNTDIFHKIASSLNLQ